MKDRHCVLLIALIITGLFADVLFLGSNFYVRDLFMYHYPMKHVVREVIARGEFPSWNPYFASGQPMAANPAYEIFYPPQWLIFIGPYRFGFALHVLFHLYLAAFGAFFFFRSIPLRRDASVFGALSFALSGFLTGTASNLPTFFVWSWAGVIGWALLRFVRGTGSVAWPALAIAMPLLVGEPVALLQLFALIFILAPIKRILAPIAIAILIAAVQLVPAIDFARDSIRSRGFSYATVTDYSLPPSRAVDLLVPFFTPAQIATNRTHYFLSIYCGAAILILALAGIATRQRGAVTLVIVALLSYLLAIGDATPLWRLLYASGMHSLRYPGKFIAIGLVALILFGTIVLDRLLNGDAKLHRATIIAGIATAIVALISPLAAITYAAWTAVAWRIGSARAWHLIALALLIFDLGPVAERVMPRLPATFFTPPAAAAALDNAHDEYAIFHRGEWQQNAPSSPIISRNGLRPYTPAAWDIRTTLEADYDETGLLPTHALLDSMRRLGNSGAPRWSDPFTLLSNVRYVVDYNPAGSTATPIVIHRVADQGRYWCARELLSSTDFEQAIRSRDIRGVAFVDSPFTAAAATVDVVHETSNSADLDVTSSGPAFLAITVTRHKYWRATIDGHPARLVGTNVAYQGLTVPAGHHRVELRYRNPLIGISGLISALTLFFVATKTRQRGDLPVNVAPVATGTVACPP